MSACANRQNWTLIFVRIYLADGANWISLNRGLERLLVRQVRPRSVLTCHRSVMWGCSNHLHFLILAAVSLPIFIESRWHFYNLPLLSQLYWLKQWVEFIAVVIPIQQDMYKENEGRCWEASLCASLLWLWACLVQLCQGLFDVHINWSPLYECWLESFHYVAHCVDSFEWINPKWELCSESRWQYFANVRLSIWSNVSLILSVFIPFVVKVIRLWMDIRRRSTSANCCSYSFLATTLTSATWRPSTCSAQTNTLKNKS